MSSPEPDYQSVLYKLLPPNHPAPLLPSASSKARDFTLTHVISSLQIHPTLEAILHVLNDDLETAHFLVRHMQSPDEPGPGMRGEAGDDLPMNYAGALGGSTTAASHSESSRTSKTSRVENPNASTRNNEPRAEGMLIHALLHRIELDTSNALAWYTDVSETSPTFFARVHPEGISHVHKFLARIQRVRGTQPHLTSVTKKYGGSEKFNSSSGDRDGEVRKELKEQGMLEGLPEGEVEGQVEALRKESEREIRALLGWCEERFGTGRYEDVRAEWRGHGEKIGEMAKKMVVGGEGWREF